VAQIVLPILLPILNEIWLTIVKNSDLTFCSQQKQAIFCAYVAKKPLSKATFL